MNQPAGGQNKGSSKLNDSWLFLFAPTVGVHKGNDRILKLGPDRSLILRVRKPCVVAGIFFADVLNRSKRPESSEAKYSAATDLADDVGSFRPPHLSILPCLVSSLKRSLFA